MKRFLDEDFLLDTQTAKELFHGTAEKLPILDYHCHVSPQDIAENKTYHNLTQLWLSGDHYKWRLMRANGVPEKLITGNSSDKEKFFAWASTLERCVGNPLYHWCHMELQRYFNCDVQLTKNSAEKVWGHCQTIIKDGIRVRDIIKKSNVTLICTTDDPIDNLKWHGKLAADVFFETIVLPAFRPDKAVNIEKRGFTEYIRLLQESTGVKIDRWQNLIDALEQRLIYFNDRGCVLADHALDNICFVPAKEEELDEILKKRLLGNSVTEAETWRYKTELLLFFARRYAKLNWAMQLHFAAQRDNNSHMYRLLGADAGFDSIGQSINMQSLAAFFDALDEKEELPRTILYSLEPNDNAALVSLIGCFQGENVHGKLQHGSAWWFNDYKEGMESQLKNLAAGGILGNFIGMLTDSRSFLSYTRHEYFRRVFCGLIGRWVETGEFPLDKPALNRLVADVSYRNGVTYFGFGRYHLRGTENPQP